MHTHYPSALVRTIVKSHYLIAKLLVLIIFTRCITIPYYRTVDFSLFIGITNNDRAIIRTAHTNTRIFKRQVHYITIFRKIAGSTYSTSSPCICMGTYRNTCI